MAEQFVDFAVVPKKDGTYHLALARRILKLVKEEQPSQRKFALWLRDNQIYDRTFLQFILKLLDVKVTTKAALGEVGDELAVEAAKGGAAALSTVADPTVKASEKKVGGFEKGLFDRFVELNGYLARFVLIEVGDGFLAPNEMVKRLQSAIYHGARPPLAGFEAWLLWLEFLGYIRNVGFRKKLSDAGIEAWKYLKELPESELLDQGTLGLLAGIAEGEEAAGDAAPAEPAYIVAQDADVPVPVAEPPGAKRRGAGGGGGDEPFEPGEDDAVDFGPAPAGAPARPIPDDEIPEEYRERERPPAPAPAKVAKPAPVPVPKAPAPAAAKAPSPAPKPAPAPAPKPAPAVAEEEGISEDEEDAIRELFGEEAAEAEKTRMAKKPAAEGDAGAGAGEADDEDEEGAEAAYQATVADDEKRRFAEPGMDLATLDARLAALTAEVGELVKEASAAEAAEAVAAEGADDAAPELSTASAPVSEALTDPVTERAPERPAAAAAAPPESGRGPLPSTDRVTRPPTPTERVRMGPMTRVLAFEPTPRDEVSAALASAPLRDEQVDLLAAQWESDPGRRHLAASHVGLDPSGYTGDKKTFFLFKLAALATILEAPGAFTAKIGLWSDLERARALDNMYTLDWPLDRALDALGILDGRREIGPLEERLLHLPRLKRALLEGGETLLRRLETALGRRAAVVRAFCGNAVGGGAYWIEREMRRLGLW